MLGTLSSGRPLESGRLPDALPSPPPRHAVPVGVAMLAATVLIAVLLRDPRTSFVQHIDNSWAGWMPDSPDDWFTVLATVVEAGLGGPTGLIVPIALAGWLVIGRRWWSILYVLTACVATDGLLIPLKDVVNRAHPDVPLMLESGGSFPSGHAFETAALVVVLGALVVRRASRPRWWLIGAAVTAVVMWSGIQVHDSWLSDTVAGALAGAGTALLLWRAFAPLLRREARTADEAGRAVRPVNVLE